MAALQVSVAARERRCSYVGNVFRRRRPSDLLWKQSSVSGLGTGILERFMQMLDPAGLRLGYGSVSWTCGVTVFPCWQSHGQPGPKPVLLCCSLDNGGQSETAAFVGGFVLGNP